MDKKVKKRLFKVLKIVFILSIIIIIFIVTIDSKTGWPFLFGLISFVLTWHIIKATINYIKHGKFFPNWKRKQSKPIEMVEGDKQEEPKKNDISTKEATILTGKDKIIIFKELDRKYFPHIKNKGDRTEEKIIDELNHFLEKVDVDPKILKQMVTARVKEFEFAKEDFHEHYAVERIIKGLENTKNGQKLGAWFKFYAYVRTTLGIIWGYANLKFYNQILTDLEVDYVYIFINETITYTGIILTIILIAGLHQKSKWGFKYNKFYIIYEWIWGAITFGIGNIISGIIFFALWYPIWVRSNRIYFNNRKHLFRQ